MSGQGPSRCPSCGATTYTPEQRVVAQEIEGLLDQNDYAAARSRLDALAVELGEQDREVVGLRTMLHFLDAPPSELGVEARDFCGIDGVQRRDSAVTGIDGMECAPDEGAEERLACLEARVLVGKASVAEIGEFRARACEYEASTAAVTPTRRGCRL